MSEIHSKQSGTKPSPTVPVEPPQELEISAEALATTEQPADTFRVKGRRLLHLVAHKEYGVVFSHCGLRTTAFDIELNPEDGTAEDHCQKCTFLSQHG